VYIKEVNRDVYPVDARGAGIIGAGGKDILLREEELRLLLALENIRNNN